MESLINTEEGHKMNIAEKMERESRLLANLVNWMECG